MVMDKVAVISQSGWTGTKGMNYTFGAKGTV